VEKAHPKLWKTPAADVGPADVRDVLAKMVAGGCKRQVNLVRAYLRAAFWGRKLTTIPAQ
jgi:hypothetical protein